MARIRGANTTPELALRAALEACGLASDADLKTRAGKADLVFAAARAAVFVDGCFWHGCPLHYARPRSREEFWSAKLVGNIERDARQSRTLTDIGWSVVRLWEHEVVEGVDIAAARIEAIVTGAAPADWPDQVRVRRVTEIAERVERRELVRLAAPAQVFEVVEGPRVTAKARTKRR